MTVKPGEKIAIDFDRLETSSSQDEKCYVNLYNGELKLDAPEQTKIPLQRIDSKEGDFTFNCLYKEYIKIPETKRKILTLEYIYSRGENATAHYSYCADLYVFQAGSATQFSSKKQAQAYLDELEGYTGDGGYGWLWVFMVLLGILLLAGILWCLGFCCKQRVGLELSLREVRVYWL